MRGKAAPGRWPAVRIIVPFPPGGSNDTVARILQPRLQEILGRPIVVDNRGGASGSVGANEAQRSPPDGYTWILVNDTLAANDTLLSLPYKATENFSYATVVGTCPYAFVTQPGAPWRSFADVVTAARAAPGSLNYATTGAGSLAHIATVLLAQQRDIRLTHVPYRGGGPALQDVLAGHVPLFMSNIVILLQHLRAGTLRALGVTTAEPSRFLAGVPTFAEQGFPGFSALTYWALLGPGGIPEPIVAAMQQAVALTLQDPNVKARMEEQGADIRASSPADTAAFIRAEAARWGAVIRDNNIKVET
ncbi:tripartite tricarboxylate transporter substrate binding protein [Paracraurococcus ruber]|uniref:Twin-arginine translocation pathway signal protein n=1 Tax=Paracraurococcus ruber TaxID=77675 RepID=A0ABS1D489_9PROT|nr:tripartite tricarboxylate transporter substrate binding protein [Paracraurococcus ruber]MBK1661614.1 twin-arginine translocation pathway signal protein [Paracraurococcus ruber]